MYTSVSYLWNHGEEQMWKNALKRYWERLKDSQKPLDRKIAELDWECVMALSTHQFYEFLHEEYFVWKYTDARRLATTRKHLERYVSEERMYELEGIKNRLFAQQHSDILGCISVASEIRGLGPAGASGLLAVLFPQKFGTVDQFVLSALAEVEGLQERDAIRRMNPNAIRPKDAAVLIDIMRRKAVELNKCFNTKFWTPRKIDMVLWSIDR